MAGRHGGLLGPGGVRVWMRVAGRCSGFSIASVNGSGSLNGVDDLLIARAATQVSFDGARNLISGRILILVEKRLRSDEEPGRTEPALGATVGRKAGLNGRQMSTVGKALNRDDGGTLNLAGQGEARQFWNTIDHDRAAPTGSKVASTLDTERADLISKHIQQDSVAWRQHLKWTSVHGCSPSLSFRSRNH